MTFIQAVQSGFRRYAKFPGRATRSEFWFWVLFTVVGGVVGEVLDLLVFGYHSINFAPITELFWLGTLLPSFAVMVRRLHDTDRSGWWWLLRHRTAGRPARADRAVLPQRHQGLQPLRRRPHSTAKTVHPAPSNLIAWSRPNR